MVTRHLQSLQAQADLDSLIYPAHHVGIQLSKTPIEAFFVNCLDLIEENCRIPWQSPRASRYPHFGRVCLLCNR